MGSSDNANWFLDCPLIDDIPDAGADFAADNAGLYWDSRGVEPISNASADIDCSFLNSGGLREPGSAKRLGLHPEFTDQVLGSLKYRLYFKHFMSCSVRSESSSKPSSKACREKMRRERLNDRFLELSSVLDCGNPPKTDKAAILSDAAQLVTQLRSEAQKLKDSNESLLEKIKELKDEKNELRDEKQRLKAEKESLEQQIKLLNAIPSYAPQPPLMPSPFAAQGLAPGHKLMVPVIGFPGYPMWQYMPPSDVDTSQDADNCPPVA